jgi:hypothetical protein
MSTQQPTPDVMVLTCARPATNETITVTLPPSVVAVLQALSDNVTVPDIAAPGQAKKKYLYAANVIWADVISMLVPYWLQQYVSILTAAQQAQITAAQSGASQQFQAGIADITVVGP